MITGVVAVCALGMTSALSAAGDTAESSAAPSLVQLAASDDGVISLAEQGAATHLTIACLRAAGVVVHGPIVGDEHGSLSYSYSASPAAIGAADASYERCSVIHQRDVEALWAEQLPSDRILRVPSGSSD